MGNRPQKKVLVIRFSAIGDIVLSTPVFKALHQAGYEVHWLVKDKFQFVLKNTAFIDQVHTFPLTQETIKELKKEDFDYIIDLQNNFKSFKIKRLLKRPTSSVRKLNWEKLVLVRLGKDLLKEERSIVKRYLATLEPLQIDIQSNNKRIYFPQKEYLLPQQQPYIAWVLGATYEGKKIHQDTILKTIQQNPQKHFVFLGGPSEERIGIELHQQSTHNTTNLCGKTSLEEAAFLMQKAQMVITNDTGLMHIASATDTPIISLWGCTSPLLGMGPHLPAEGSVVIEPLNRKKRPCSKLGNHCKYPQICSSTITPNQITEAINTL